MYGQPLTGQLDPVEEAPAAAPASADGRTRPERAGTRASLTSPLRQAGYAVLLVALCFIQAPGLMVADTKFDLLTGPWRFLARGLKLWDPHAAFGQIGDQSYGYAFPMGPFFGLGELLDLPPWVVQRLWWSLLVCAAFFGMLRLCTRLGIGTDLTRVLAAFAFVLTPRFTTLIGVVSVEVWPMALAPWVLLPLVKGSKEGSVRRAAAVSALVVGCCGGVNAVAVAAVLPLGVIWIVSRAPGPRRWPLLGWWTLFVLLVTAWWSGPLLLLGRYSPPFLDYIENATITTLPTDITRSLLGVSDWVAYFGGSDFGGGLRVIGTPFLLLDAALVAAIGLAGVAMRDNPHRRFLLLGLLTGLLLVGLGYSRDLAGFFAETRLHTLDGALAALRNVHKFDVVLRLPLVLGLAHGLARLPGLVRGAGSVAARNVFRVAVGFALLGLLTPWLSTVIPASGGVSAVPAYWQRTADYLAAHDDGTTALELPASSFGIYSWGNVHDDVLQGLARSPWAVRSVVPLAQPGNVVFLDAVTRTLESGHPSATLGKYLAANGVGTLVVRNDLDRLLTGSPDPAYIRSVLAQTPGIHRAASFGPLVGSPPFLVAPDAKHTRIVTGAGISDATRAIDVYAVDAPAHATLSDPGEVLVGDPSTPTDPGAGDLVDVPRVLAADRSGTVTGQVLSDDMKRREMNFPAVRWNDSDTLTPGEPFRLHGRVQSHRVVTDERRWDTVESWSGGVRRVTASSSQAYADATPPLANGELPGAVFDLDSSTSWASARDSDPHGQWWQARFTQPRPVGTVALRLARDSVKLRALRISGGGQTRTVKAPAPGAGATYAVGLPATRTLRVTAVYAGPLLTGSVMISEIAIDDLHPQRFLTLPAPLNRGPVDRVALSRAPDRNICAEVGAQLACDAILTAPGEDGDTLARRFTVPRAARYTLQVTGSLRRHDLSWPTLLRGTGVHVDVTPQPDQDPAQGSGAMVDGDPSTTWVAGSQQPVIHLTLRRPTRLGTMKMSLDPAAAASQPNRVEVWSQGRHRVVDLDPSGLARLPHWKVTRLRLRIDSTYPAFSDQGSSYAELPPGITELQLGGRSLTSPTRTLTLPCGAGPKLYVDGSFYDTALSAGVRDLVHGASVPLSVCGAPKVRLDGPATLVAGPTKAVRVDAVTFDRVGATAPLAQAMPVTRDGGGSPSSVDLPARDAAQVLTLPQNINPGWQATLHGRRLAPQRVDGWKQGWLVPAGAAGAVALTFTPNRLFDVVLVVGVVLALLCLLAATPLGLRKRRSPLPALVGGRPGVLDAVLVVATAGLLTGWAGLVVVTLVWLAARRWGALGALGGWGVPAAVALLLAAAGLTWGPLKGQPWTMYWVQVWGMVAVAAVSLPLLARFLPGGAGVHQVRAGRPSERS